MRWRRWGCWLWLVCLPLLTCVRVPIWQSEAALWMDAAEKAPLKVRPILNLGNAAQQAGDTRLAHVRYEHALTLSANPDRPIREQQVGWAMATTNLAILAANDGRSDDAVRLIGLVRERFPKFQQAVYVEQQIYGWRKR